MKLTSNYNLKKPEGTDIVNINDFNDNADIIDTQLKNASDHSGNKNNPHGVTKAHVGLSNVDNVKQASKAEFTTHLADYTQLKGDLSTLKTNAKDSIPNIVNELFTNVSDGKNLVGGAITGVDGNVVIPTDPTFQQLANAIGQISTGKKWASGTASIGNNAFFKNLSGDEIQSRSVTATGLGFVPRLIIIVRSLGSILEHLTIYTDLNKGSYPKAAFAFSNISTIGHNYGTTVPYRVGEGAAYVNDVGFLLPIQFSTGGVTWLAYE